MIWTKNQNPGTGNGSYHWQTNKPVMTKPTINPVAVKVKGKMMYLGTGKDEGKQYIKKVFDNLWNPVKGKVRPKFDRRKKAGMVVED